MSLKAIILDFSTNSWKFSIFWKQEIHETYITIILNEILIFKGVA